MKFFWFGTLHLTFRVGQNSNLLLSCQTYPASHFRDMSYIHNLLAYRLNKVELALISDALSLCTRFSNFGFRSLFQTWKKIEFKTNLIFFEFELDFYCLCSLQKSISKSNWYFSFLNLIFWYWKKFEWHSISQKSSGERQGVSLEVHSLWIRRYLQLSRRLEL